MVTWGELRDAIDEALKDADVSANEQERQELYDSEAVGYVAVAYDALDTGQLPVYDEFGSDEEYDHVDVADDVLGHFEDLAKDRIEGGE